MVKNKNFTTKRMKRLFLRKWFVLVVLAFLISGGIYLFSRGDNAPEIKTPSDTLNVNTQPATEQEKTETEQHKKELPSASDTSISTGQKKTVKPIMTDTSNNSVKAYVSGVFEDGGTCTAVFTKDGKTLTKISTGFEYVSYTQCAPINYESGFLSAGKWTVTVKYSSTVAEGVSEPQTIDIK